ncbi:MAG TPA: nucleotidyl transferase AbiEii/AbiGii toxin family protein [Acidimicrobiales bacterium]|nr:nucleotidyl transferase AbiEii/AbiGii toxin family protein [Acidimicrobiales bacterium]
MEHDDRRVASDRGELTVLTRHAITRRADEDGVGAAVVERDYVLAHIVAQLHRLQLPDGSHLVFKGGTALRLVHIGNYRYSADLDFTLINGSVVAATAAMADVLAAALEHTGMPMLELTEGDSPAISYVGPLGAGKPRRIKLDLSDSEVVESVEQRTILPDVWPDLPDEVPFDVYPIKEITAEKLRCIIQRVQCRDIYDIFRLVEDVGVDLAKVRPLFERKAEAKGIDPASFEERIEDRLDRYKIRWETEMPEHVADPPRFDDVVRVVRRHLRGAGLIGL